MPYNGKYHSKIIKLISGDLCPYQDKDKKMIFYKDFIIQDYYISLNDKIKDFIQLKNENLILLSSNNKVLIYNSKNNLFHLQKEIQIENNNNIYYRIKDINNNVAILSNKNNEKAFLIYLKYPDYIQIMR